MHQQKFREIKYIGSNIITPIKYFAFLTVSWTRGQIGVNFITWIGSTGRKSLSLAKRLETGTQNSLIVFVNRQNSLVYSRIQHLVEEIGE